MKLTKIHENHITALLFAVVMCFSLVAVKSAAAQTEQPAGVTVVDVTQEADVASEDVSDDREEMLEQIASLRELIAERRAQLQEQRSEYREERKEQFQINREEFVASLEGLSPEEKRAAMMEFVAQLREHIAQRQAEIMATVQEVRETRRENRDEFRSSLDGLSTEDRIAAIMERVAEIRQQIEERMNDVVEDNSSNEVEDEDQGEEPEVDEVDKVAIDEVNIDVDVTVSQEPDFVNQDLQVLRDCFFGTGEGDCESTDFNDDGVVNFIDLGEFRSALQYDLSGDELVDLSEDGADVQVLRDCFFTTITPDSDASCVAADHNDDGVVNTADLGLQRSAEVYDLDKSGIVDLRDDTVEFPEEV